MCFVEQVGDRPSWRRWTDGVPAVALWVRATLRRRWAATVVLAIVAGLAAGTIGASLQSARRAKDAVSRHQAHSRAYDLLLQACPREVGPAESFEQALRECVSPSVMARFDTEVVQGRDDVSATTVVATYVGAVFDPTARNGWGRGGVMYAVVGDDPIGFIRDQVLVSGRFADPAATDEVVVGERAAHVMGLHPGDVIRLASWRQDNVDAATSAGVLPDTKPFECKVVGVVRYDTDVQSSQEGDLTDATFPDAIYVEKGWVTAHGAEFATYGAAVAVRVRDGVDLQAFSLSVQADSHGWFMSPPEVGGNVDLPSLRRSVDSERQATLLFAIVGLAAGMAFVGLTLARQLRRELGDAPVLSAVGFTRSDVVLGAVIRSLAVGLAAAIVAGATIVLVSPFSPVGIAGRLEYEHPIRFDWVILSVVCMGTLLFFAFIAAVSILRVGVARRRSSRRVVVAPRLPPVPRMAALFARGWSPRMAGVVGAVAIGVAVAAGVIVASFDRVIDHPARYGAWWDVAVGQYSDPAEVQAAVGRLADNAAVADVGGMLEESTTAIVDGVGVPYIAVEPELGGMPTVSSAGRAPNAMGEIALGAQTARVLHKGIGDDVVVTSTNNDYSVTVNVVGIVVLNNPINDASNAGVGVLIVPQLVGKLADGTVTAQSLVVRFASGVDRKAAIASIVRDFGGSTRLAGPPGDLRNLQRLRSVPWLLASLIVVLALASLVHALVTMLQRHRQDLAVLAALGMTTRQRRRVGVGSGLLVIGLSVVIGVPAGLVVGRLVWRVVARRVFIPSGPVMPWLPAVFAPVAAATATALVALIAIRLVTRRVLAAELRSQ